jgi:hypothetical protein
MCTPVDFAVFASSQIAEYRIRSWCSRGGTKAEVLTYYYYRAILCFVNVGSLAVGTQAAARKLKK